MYIDHPDDMMRERVTVLTISVIDAPKESYDEYHERMEREKGAKRVPFGFGIREEEGDEQ